MKKIYSFLILFFGVFGLVNSQIDVKIQQSKIFENDKKDPLFLSTKSDGQGGVITVRSSKDYYITHYDKNLNLVSEMKLENDDMMFFDLIVHEGKIHIIARNTNKKSKILEFIVFTSEISSFNFKKSTLFSVNFDDISTGYGYLFTGGNNDVDDFGEMFYSEDETFFAISIDYKGDGKETHRVAIYDKNIKPIFDDIIVLESDDNNFVLQNIEIDESTGAIFMLGKQSENKNKDDKNKANYHYVLLKYTPDGEHQETSFQNDKFIASMVVKKKGDNLVCAGLYSEKSDNRYKGIARFDVNPQTLAVVNQSFQPFNEQFMIDKYGKNKVKELRDLVYKDIHLFDNGDIIINAEEYEERSTQSSNLSHNYYYIYDDIITCKVNKAGQLVYARCIKKNQVIGLSENRKYVSYSSILYNNKNYFFFNADKVKEKKGKILFDGHIDHLYGLMVDSEGNISHKPLLSEKESDVIFYANAGEKISPNEIIIIGNHKKDRRLVRIEVK